MLAPKDLPIVFIHNGNSDYLPYSLIQVRETNPANPIYLLGDKSNACFGNIVQHRLVKNYFEKATAFAPHYEHHSSNGHDYELFCIQRWFVLLEFLERNNFDQCLYLDSDILYFGSVCKEQLATATHGLTSVTKSPHTNYVNSRAALADFCGYITDCYATQQGKIRLAQYLKEHTDIHGPVGGISDMTFFLQYRKLHTDRILDLSQVFESAVGPFTYDITIDTPNGYQTETSGLKAVTFDGRNQPHILNLNSKEQVRYVTLHFQGHSKAHMGQYVRNKPANYDTLLSGYNRIRTWQRVVGKVKRMVGMK